MSSEINILYDNPFVFLVINLTFLFGGFLLYFLNTKVKTRGQASEKKINEKVDQSAEKHKVDVSEHRNPYVQFGILLALVAYTVIAWFVRDQLDNRNFDTFYQFYAGFVLFLIVWISWNQISLFLHSIFLKKNPTLDLRTHLKTKAPKKLLLNTVFTNLISKLGFPTVVFGLILIFFPQPFFFGIFFVLLIGIIQNVVNFIRITR